MYKKRQMVYRLFLYSHYKLSFRYPKISIRNMHWIRQMWPDHSRRGHCSWGTVRRYSLLCQLGNSLWSSESPLPCSKFGCHLYHISWRDPVWRPYKMIILSIMLKVINFFHTLLNFIFLNQSNWNKISISNAKWSSGLCLIHVTNCILVIRKYLSEICFEFVKEFIFIFCSQPILSVFNQDKF